MVSPTGTQAENDLAARGQTVKNKQADGSPLDPVTPPWLQTAPYVTSPPVISGPNPPVVGSHMSCSNGAWVFATSFSYQWRRGVTNIPGATTASYTVVTGDKTFTLTCVVTAVGAKGLTPTNSNTTATVP
jgi:hypothetical protein